jgi:hypothetical protein
MQISEMLTGGDPRSLGKTDQVVKLVLSHPERLEELFDCVFHPDEVVRMRAGDALEKVCCQEPKWFEPFKERLLNEVSGINQASVKWHLAQMFGEITMSLAEKERAVNIMLHNLETSGDWIVINLTLESLAKFARENVLNHDEFVSLLKKHQQSPYKSVASRANKLLRKFEHD